MSEGTKTVTKQKKFVDEWLSDPQFKDWLRKDANDNTIARCFICSAKISLSTAGRSALTDHGKGKKHSDALAKPNNFFTKQKKTGIKSPNSESNSENEKASSSGNYQMTLNNYVSRAILKKVSK